MAVFRKAMNQRSIKALTYLGLMNDNQWAVIILFGARNKISMFIAASRFRNR